MKKITLSTIILLVSCFVIAKPGLYSGSASVYAKKGDVLALHEHGVRYSYEENQLTFFSTLNILNLSYNKGKKVNVNLNDVPALVALKWVDDEYLVGISNIPKKNNANIILYNSSGELVNKKILDCNAEENIRAAFFCAKSPEQDWISHVIGGLELKRGVSSIRVCIDHFCTDIEIENIK